MSITLRTAKTIVCTPASANVESTAVHGVWSVGTVLTLAVYSVVVAPVGDTMDATYASSLYVEPNDSDVSNRTIACIDVPGPVTLTLMLSVV